MSLRDLIAVAFLLALAMLARAGALFAQGSYSP